jgi:hypothetical protein
MQLFEHVSRPDHTPPRVRCLLCRYQALSRLSVIRPVLRYTYPQLNIKTRYNSMKLGNSVLLLVYPIGACPPVRSAHGNLHIRPVEISCTSNFESYPGTTVPSSP